MWAEGESEGLQTLGIVVAVCSSLKLLHYLGLIHFSNGKRAHASSFSMNKLGEFSGRRRIRGRGGCPERGQSWTQGSCTGGSHLWSLSVVLNYLWLGMDGLKGSWGDCECHSPHQCGIIILLIDATDYKVLWINLKYLGKLWWCIFL